MPDAPFDLQQAHRWFAAQCFNETWALLDKPDRNAADDATMVHCAHASRWHWEQVGDASNLAVGEWQIARVYATLGRGDAAMRHAEASLTLCHQHKLSAFLLGCACEACARAAKASGESDYARELLTEARGVLALVTDADEIEVLTADIEECGQGL